MTRITQSTCQIIDLCLHSSNFYSSLTTRATRMISMMEKKRKINSQIILKSACLMNQWSLNNVLSRSSKNLWAIKLLLYLRTKLQWWLRAILQENRHLHWGKRKRSRRKKTVHKNLNECKKWEKMNSTGKLSLGLKQRKLSALRSQKLAQSSETKYVGLIY